MSGNNGMDLGLAWAQNLSTKAVVRMRLARTDAKNGNYSFSRYASDVFESWADWLTIPATHGARASLLTGAMAQGDAGQNVGTLALVDPANTDVTDLVSLENPADTLISANQVAIIQHPNDSSLHQLMVRNVIPAQATGNYAGYVFEASGNQRDIIAFVVFSIH